MLTYSNKTWISANAGAGKTYTLVKHIVTLLLNGATASSILCLTYTKAAANEMHARLLKRLEEFAFIDDAQLDDALANLLARPVTSEDKNRARYLLYEIIDATPGIGFFTLHGFCQRLLASFPLEAGISPHSSLMNDEQTAVMQQAALMHVLTKALHTPMLEEAITALQTQSTDISWQSMLLKSLNDTRQWQTVWSGLDSISSLQSMLNQYCDIDDSTVIARLVEHYQKPHLNTLRDIIVYAQKGTKTDIKNASVLTQWCEIMSMPDKFAHTTKIQDVWKQYCNLWLTDKEEKRKNVFTQAVTKKIDITSLIEKEQEFVLAQLDAGYRTHTAQISYYFTLILYHCYQEYSERKQREHRMDYQDLISCCLTLLSDDTVRPWIMHTLDYRIAHLLVDEAQDTSADQWRIVSALITELWQSGLSQARSLLIVGDIKQSIYSFQGAAPHLFPLMREHFSQLLTASDDTLITQTLKKSYRSVPAILSFIDEVLTHPLCKDMVHLEGAAISHTSSRDGHEGKIVCFTPFTKQEDDRKSSQEKTEPLTSYLQEDSAKMRWVNHLADMIACWIKDGKFLVSRGRNVEAGDILILLQSRKPLAPLILQALEKRQIPVSGLDRLQMSSHLAIIDHLAFFEWCIHPYDDMHLAIALRSPFGNISEEELLLIAADRGTQTLWEALCVKVPLHPVIAHFKKMRQIALGNPPHLALQKMHRICGLREAFGLRFGAEVQEVLDAFFQEAQQYSVTNIVSLRGFIDYIRALNTSLKRESSSHGNTVRVMTVHGAKGLEAPIVICADATHMIDTKKEQIFFASHNNGVIPLLRLGDTSHSSIIKQQMTLRKHALVQEYYRLLYVAFTRAEDELYIGGYKNSLESLPDNDKEFFSWLDMAFYAISNLPNVKKYDDGRMEFSSTQESGLPLYKDKQLHLTVPEKPISVPLWYDLPVSDNPMLHRIYSPSNYMIDSHDKEKRYDEAFNSAGNKKHVEFAADRGRVIHQVLQWIATIHPTTQISLSDWIATLAPHWNKDAIESAACDVWRLWRDKNYQFLWQQNVQKEVSIIGTLNIDGKKTRFSGQIDVLVSLDNKTRVIIDYKTAENIPDIQAIPLAYLTQLAIYKSLIHQSDTSLHVQTALLYTTEPKLIYTDAFLPNITTALLDETTDII